MVVVVVVVVQTLRVVRVDAGVSGGVLVVVVLRGVQVQVLEVRVLASEARGVGHGPGQRRLLPVTRVVEDPPAAVAVRRPTASQLTPETRLRGRGRLAQQGQIRVRLTHCAVVVLVVLEVSLEVRGTKIRRKYCSLKTPTNV